MVATAIPTLDLGSMKRAVEVFTGMPLAWADVPLLAHDRYPGGEQSQQFRAAVQNLFGDLVLGVFGQLANAAGFQGEKVGIYHQVGDNAEATSTEAVPEIGGGYRG